MKANVAGAGAGKTTRMADLITNYTVPEGKIVFCIAFTNAAADHIKEKVAKKLGRIPNSIKISTIHSFLYQELIEPYYYFLYGKHYEQFSTIRLSVDERIKAQTLAKLENSNILHITKIPERAKWVAYQKSNDKKAIKDLREKILTRFKNYCAAIFVDEAQDISEDISIILNCLDKIGIEIILYGDPKQDVKGFGSFRQMINSTNDVIYISDCHRCPQKHLDLSNTLAPDPEKQIAGKENAIGSLEAAFESDIVNIKEYIDTGNFGLKYISKKNERYDTHAHDKNSPRFEILRHEVYRAIDDKWREQKTEIQINRFAFYVTECMLRSFDTSGNAAPIIRYWVDKKAFDWLASDRYAQMVSAFTLKEAISSDAVVMSSIEIIKGLEAERCLFILTSDLAPYLFRKKTDDNKTSHLLYVALTRSLEHLTILVTKEVEEKYTRDSIIDFFRKNGVIC